MELVRTLALSFAVLLVSLALLFFSLLYFLQEKLIFVPDPLPTDFVYSFSRPFEEKVVTVGDDKIDSLLFTTRGAPSLILYFHGNAGSLSSWGAVAADLVKGTGADVWVLDYPGYGKSTGAIASEVQLMAIGQEFYRLASERARANGQKLFLYGRSIGTGIAAELAAGLAADLAADLFGGGSVPLAGLVLESPYFNLATLASRQVPLVPKAVIARLLKYRFATDENLKRVRAPVLILHGDHDETIPVIHAETLKERSVPGAELVIVAGAGHNDLADHGEYWQALTKFVHDR